MATTAPKGLGSAGRAAYRHGVEVLRALSQDPAHSASALERYARACDDAEHLRGEWERLGYPVLRDGGGMERAHPLPDEIRAAERLAADLADGLGLTPLGRRRLRVGSRGLHRSPDRKAEMIRLVKPEREGSA